MSQSVETAVRAAIHEGQRLSTPSRHAPFVVECVDDHGIVLLFGAQRTPTRLRWECLEGVATYLRTRGWIDIGMRYSVDADRDTLDAYLKTCVKRATAGWVAVVLATAGVVEIDEGRPARVRLKAGIL